MMDVVPDEPASFDKAVEVVRGWTVFGRDTFGHRLRVGHIQRDRLLRELEAAGEIVPVTPYQNLFRTRRVAR